MTMSVFLLSLAVFAVALLGMSVGVIFSNRRIQGSCGGMERLRDKHGDMRCESCRSEPSPDCSVHTHGVCQHGHASHDAHDRALSSQAHP
jgi:hypothetical protein